jgi:ParB family chromosome partitioning protein
MAATRKKKPLGRNLDALLGRSSKAEPKARAITPAVQPEVGLVELSLDAIEPGRYQPRSAMDPDKLEALAESIRSQGLVQPVIVRPLAKAGRYELIAGERRWRASQLAGKTTIPAIIREVADEATLALALIENIQREDLSPIEEALALRRLITEFDLTHEQAAKQVGRSRAAVSNLLRLLELAEPVRALLDARQIDMGHARALLSLAANHQAEVARQVINLHLSVRQTEALVQRLKAGKSAKKGATKGPGSADPNIQAMQQQLSEKLCAPVAIRHAASGRGQIIIDYTSLDEFDGLSERLLKA